MHTIQNKTLPKLALVAVSALFTAGSSWAQATAESSEVDDEEVVVLSPFEVSAEEEQQRHQSCCEAKTIPHATSI